jgi:hypothetical protein
MYREIRQALIPQSRQSAKLFLQSSELELPQPLTRRRVCPPTPHPPVLGGGAHSLARGVGRVPIPTRRHRYTVVLWYSLYIRTLWLILTEIISIRAKPTDTVPGR